MKQTKSWTARLRRSDGTERIVRPRHLVFANGVSSYPFIPDLPGIEDFKGEVVHSEGFTSGAAWKGKNALILGTGSSANDIALDLHSHGVEHDADPARLDDRGVDRPERRLNEAVWDEGPPLEDCDLIVSSATPSLIVQAYKLVAKRMLELDKEMIEGLRAIGFKHDMGEDESRPSDEIFPARRRLQSRCRQLGPDDQGRDRPPAIRPDRALHRRWRAAEGWIDGSGRCPRSGDRLLSADGACPPRARRGDGGAHRTGVGHR